MTPFEKAAKKGEGCGINHREKAINCKKGVIYDIPLACGFRYIGQTGRCVNERFNEHRRNIRISAPGSELARHLNDCNNCYPVWENCAILEIEADAHKRLLKETLQINGSGNCISKPSLRLEERELEFLGF